MPSESTAVKVVSLVRPLTDEEKSKGCKKILKVNGDKLTIEGGGKEQSYSFDHCYGPNVHPSQIYSEQCASLVQKCVLGYNVTIMSFGATGSGKTHVMAGSSDDPGVITCLTGALFRHLTEVCGSKKDGFVTVSYVEILDEQLTDMLNPHPNEMKIREHPQLGIYVDGLSELVAHSDEELTKLYIQAIRARKMGATDIRAHRARSTGIFTIHVEIRERGINKVGIKSSITLVDLAGMEKVEGKSGDVKTKGSVALVSVLNALKKGGHVPYRDSKVTRLIQPSLGGNAVTVILAAFSPADKSYQDTLHTLSLAQNVRSVKNQVKVNLDETRSVIGELREEITHLRTKITKDPESSKEDILKMENLIRDLQIAKTQTWEEKERLSQKYEEERKTNLANKGILEWVMDTVRKGNKEIQERIILLQKEKDQLTLEYRDKRKKVDDMKDDLQKKISDYSKLAEGGKVNESETKQRVTAIHELKEKLKRETENLKDTKKRLKDVQDKQRNEKEEAQGQTMVKGNAELRQMVEAEERKRMETENKAMVADELERSRIEAEAEKAEIQMRAAQGKAHTVAAGAKLETEVVELRAERSVVTLQLQALQQEKERLSQDLSQVYDRHKEELEIQQLQHFQTFRQYREMFEQQKMVLEQRYRGLLEDAVSDAVFLSTRNNELMLENHALKQEIAQLKDKLTVAEGSRPISTKSKK